MQLFYFYKDKKLEFHVCRNEPDIYFVLDHCNLWLFSVILALVPPRDLLFHENFVKIESYVSELKFVCTSYDYFILAKKKSKSVRTDDVPYLPEVQNLEAGDREIKYILNM